MGYSKYDRVSHPVLALLLPDQIKVAANLAFARPLISEMALPVYAWETGILHQIGRRKISLMNAGVPLNDEEPQARVAVRIN